MRKFSSSQRRLWNLFFYWAPLIVWMAWIFFWSSRPRLPRPNRRVGVGDHTFEFWAHAFTFAVLTVLAWRVVRYQPRLQAGPLGRMSLLAAGCFAALYGASDEWHQHFVPGRWPSLEDWAADLLGIAIAAVGVLIWGWLWERWGRSLKARLPLPNLWR